MPDQQAHEQLHLVVDLTPLLPGGQNGGVKPFIFEYLGWLGRQSLRPLRFTFLTRRSTHIDVRPLARCEDQLICILDDAPEVVILSPSHSPSEREWFHAPEDLVSKLRADVLYLPFGSATWHFPGVPTLATVVDVLHRDYPLTLSSGEVSRREHVMRDMIKKVDWIQGISRYTLERVTYHYDFPPERTLCSYIAIHERLASPESGDVSVPDGPFFLYPANAWRHKNHEILLLAYRIYRERLGPAAWDLVLTGHLDEAMERVLHLADVLRLKEHVHILGHVPTAAYASIWRRAGALVFPSLHEGFGIPLVEAMAFGVPIIASTAGSLPEVGGDACLLVDALKPHALTAALEKITKDCQLRADLRDAGRQRLLGFSFLRDAKAFLETIIAVAQAPARRTSCGFYPDGWTKGCAAVTLPPVGDRCSLDLRLRPMPEMRTVRMFHGRNTLGTHVTAINVATRISIPLIPDNGTIILEIPDASRLSEGDHRTHGVWIESFELCGPHDNRYDLLAPAP